jgi:hypothetical protein
MDLTACNMEKKKVVRALFYTDDWSEEFFVRCKKKVLETITESDKIMLNVSMTKDLTTYKQGDYDVILVDYGYICHGNERNNINILKNALLNKTKVIWCGGLGDTSRYIEKAKDDFPKDYLIHDLPSCGLDADYIMLTLERLFVKEKR